MRIAFRRVDHAVVVELAGEVDLDTAPRVHAAVTEAFHHPGTSRYVLDLTDVAFLGSAGLVALVDATQQAQARSEPLLVVVDSNRPVIRPIQITGLDDVLRLCHSVEEALTADPTP